MKHRSFKNGRIAGGLTVLGLLVVAAARGDEADSADAPTPTVVTVQTGTLQLMTLHRRVQGYGTVDGAPATTNQAAASAQLAAPAAGIVSKVTIVEGQLVKKGDILVELNSGATTHELARQELTRQKQLFAQQNTSLRNVENAEAQLASLEIASPLAGTVTRVSVKPGMAVDSTTVVAEVMDLNRLAVSAEIPADVPGLAPGEAVEIAVEPPVTAILSYISPVVNKDNDTVVARALVPAGCGLRPGQFVPVSIVTEAHTNCLAAPAASVVMDDDGKSSVAVISGTDAVKTAVQTGLRENGWVEIAAPELKPGDTVVTVGAYGLPDKTKVAIQNSANTKAAATAAPDSP